MLRLFYIIFWLFCFGLSPFSECFVWKLLTSYLCWNNLYQALILDSLWPGMLWLENFQVSFSLLPKLLKTQCSYFFLFQLAHQLRELSSHFNIATLDSQCWIKDAKDMHKRFFFFQWNKWIFFGIRVPCICLTII